MSDIVIDKDVEVDENTTPKVVVDNNKTSGDNLDGNPIDSVIRIHISVDKMSAIARVTPPYFGGKGPTLEDILDVMIENKIVYGIDEDAINRLIKYQIYNVDLEIARGKKPVHGKNQIVEELFPRERKLEFKPGKNGIVDFKSVNIVSNVTKGTVICNIIPVTDGEDGINIFNEVVPHRKGKNVAIPRGKGTILSEDYGSLLADIDGNISFTGTSFCVKPVFEVFGNVDNGIGNIDFNGDIVVYGDVYEGFTLKAAGSISIAGMIEGCTIECAGDLKVGVGISGMNKASIRCNSNLSSPYLENCPHVVVKGSIQANELINCNINCDKSLILNNKGIIVGGECAIGEEIQANILGTNSNVMTKIVLGITPELLQESRAIKAEIKKLSSEMEQIIRESKYLTDANRGTLAKDKKIELLTLKKHKIINLSKMSMLKKRLREIEEVESGLEDCRMTINTCVHANVSISIGNATHHVHRKIQGKTLFFYHEAQVKVSSM